MSEATDLPGLDLGALAAHLGHGPLSGELVSGGRSNLTYLVCDERRSWIVRRPPLGHVLATAHDMAREYRVMTALAPTCRSPRRTCSAKTPRCSARPST